LTGVALGQVKIEVDGEGTAVLFVHGLGGTSNSFQMLLGALAGFRCVRPDLPGSGRSPRPFGALTMAGFVETVGDIVRRIAGGPVHLVGHSMGTLVCQHLAAGMPEWVKSLTLFGPILEPPEPARQRLRDRARTARQDGLIGIADAAAGGLSSATKAANPLAALFLRESHMRQDAEGFAQTCEALAGAQAADLRLIRCPTLLITGDEDSVAPASMAQAIADKVHGAAVVRVLERCGHWTPVERPQDCARLLSEHVRAQAPR
jgi:3-oxoadipate enol-lactonase